MRVSEQEQVVVPEGKDKAFPLRFQTLGDFPVLDKDVRGPAPERDHRPAYKGENFCADHVTSPILTAQTAQDENCHLKKKAFDGSQTSCREIDAKCVTDLYCTGS